MTLSTIVPVFHLAAIADPINFLPVRWLQAMINLLLRSAKKG
jgi:hypothetical protein